MAAAASSGSGLFKFMRPSARLQATDIQAAAMWGVAATTTALWIVQVPPPLISLFNFFSFMIWIWICKYYLLLDHTYDDFNFIIATTIA